MSKPKQTTENAREQVLARMWLSRGPWATLSLGQYNRAAAPASGPAGPHTLRHSVTVWPRNATLEIRPRELTKICPHRPRSRKGKKWKHPNTRPLGSRQSRAIDGSAVTRKEACHGHSVDAARKHDAQRRKPDGHKRPNSV